MSTVIVTKEEVKAMKALERLSKKWPNSLQLFGWAGTLTVLKKNEEDKFVCVDGICNLRGMYCDGGDPSSDEVDQSSEVIYE